MHALYRRTAFAHGTPAPALPHPDASFLSPLHNGDASFDPTKEGDWILADQGWALRTPNHQIVRLTTAEREFLTQLFASPDHLFLRSNQDQGGAADLISKRKLDVVVSRLRVKVGNAGHPLPLHTCRGMGYQFSGRVLIAELNSFPHRLGHSGSEVDRVTFS
ncbi:helix-turn-helix domain-containing protein [Achromobacter pestifer]